MKWFINRGEIKREREREAQPVQHVLILQKRADEAGTSQGTQRGSTPGPD
jgi:hypothetical protein